VESRGTHREVTANKQDIIIKNKKNMHTDRRGKISADRNVMQKEAEKKLKYKSLCTEIQWMWNMNCVITPAVIGATGTVTRGLRKNSEAKPVKQSIDSLQKVAVRGTSHIMRKVLQPET
jgi:hypothetical protein